MSLQLYSNSSTHALIQITMKMDAENVYLQYIYKSYNPVSPSYLWIL